MTNIRELKSVYQPLTRKHSDLFQIGSHWLCLKPVHHVALRILIERSSDADLCFPQWTMLKTFIPGWDANRSLGFSGLIVRPAGREKTFWRWSDPTMVDDMIEAIENHALPLLRSMDRLENFVEFYDRDGYRTWREWPEHRMIIETAMGNLDAAREVCLTLVPEVRDDLYPDDPSFQRRRNTIMTLAEPLLAGDRATLATILHAWEAANCRGSKIERYWERTPFPLEAGLA